MHKHILITCSVLSLICTAFATPVVVSNDATWNNGAVINTGEPGSSQITQSGNNYTLDYEGQRDVKNQRPIMQSFQLPAGAASLEVSDVHLLYNGFGGTTDSIDIIFFELTDVFNAGIPTDDDITLNPPPGGTEVYRHSISVSPASNVANPSLHVLHLSITGLTLNAQAGDAGYGFMLYNPETNGVYPFRWRAERDAFTGNGIDAGPYVDGRPYSDNEGSFQEYHDLALAIDGVVTPIPEPGTSALFAGVGALLGLLVYRRKFRK